MKQLTGKAREFIEGTKEHYNYCHREVRKKKGKASKCTSQDCKGTSTLYDWALIKGQEYSDNPNDYIELCRSCHMTYDGINVGRTMSDETKRNLSEFWKGRIPVNKGQDSRIIKVCTYCSTEYKAYRTRNKKYCSEECKYKDMIGKPSRSKNGRRGNERA